MSILFADSMQGVVCAWLISSHLEIPLYCVMLPAMHDVPCVVQVWTAEREGRFVGSKGDSCMHSRAFRENQHAAGPCCRNDCLGSFPSWF